MKKKIAALLLIVGIFMAGMGCQEKISENKANNGIQNTAKADSETYTFGDFRGEIKLHDETRYLQKYYDSDSHKIIYIITDKNFSHPVSATAVTQ